jgi:hypothetical protein
MTFCGLCSGNRTCSFCRVSSWSFDRSKACVANLDFSSSWNFNKGVTGPFLTSPLGANFDPRGEVVPQGWSYPLGVKFSVRPSILLNSSVHPWGWTKGWTFPLGDKFHPWEPSPLLGLKFTLGASGEDKNGPMDGANPTTAAFKTTSVLK